ncbi:type VI secretion system-associated FHA domain protein TagH [Colwellia sp. E150_009]
MPFLQLKLVSKIEIGQNSTCSFSHQGGSIGRSNDCDWTLVDVDRYISNKHALISYQNEQFLITDTSSNGVFINNARTPLGKNNTHVITQSDHIKIGRYEIEVDSLQILDTPIQVENQSAQVGDGDLLGLVMGDAANHTSENEADYLNISKDNNFDLETSSDESLGLNDILSGASNYPPSHKSEESIPSVEHQAEYQPEQKSEYFEPKKPPVSNQHSVSNDASIPEDWELSGILPAIQDYEPPKASPPITQESTESSFNVQPSPVQVDPVTPVERVTPVQPIAPVDPVTPVASITPVEPVSPIEHVAPVVPSEPEKSNDSIVSQPTENGSNEFLSTLYNKLGLPKEYLASIDEEQFAEDIATVMLSTTKGLMSLLNSRTVFKQESRLSLTSVQPRSNNPIKFSIDPVDTLEMLLLKKKKGYLTAKESYDEAVSDIQLHQMAFLSGLQATVTGVLNQISPESIENQINEKGRSFMGLKASSQYWQLYKDKQELLAKSVTENLNEVLSTYFSEAYQAQINNFKNDKK